MAEGGGGSFDATGGEAVGQPGWLEVRNTGRGAGGGGSRQGWVRRGPSGRGLEPVWMEQTQP